MVKIVRVVVPRVALCDTVEPVPDSDSEDFIARVEREADRILRKQKPGPKDNNQRNQDRLN